MRKVVLAAAVVVGASVGLTACSGPPTVTSIKAFIASFGAHQYTQVQLNAAFSGAGASKVEKILKEFSLGVRVANPTGGTISQGRGTNSSEVLVDAGSATLLDLRQVGGNLYAKANLNALSGIPGVNIPPSELAGLDLFIGNRWFEFPKSLLNKFVPAGKTPADQHSEASVRALQAKLIDGIATLLAKSPYKKVPNGYQESGTILQFVRAIVPAIRSVDPKATTPTHARGTYKVTLTSKGSGVTGLTISVTAPNGTGNATGTVNATVSHDSVTIPVPSGATVISQSLLNELKGLAGIQTRQVSGVSSGTPTISGSPALTR
jgi:hypothetical protein